MQETQPTLTGVVEETPLMSPPSSLWPHQLGSRPRDPKISFLSQSPNDRLMIGGDSASGVSEVDELEIHHATAPVSTSDSNIPNPWIDDPNPTSEIYPGITSQLKSFINSPKAMHDPRETWPYRLYPADEKKVLFFEFRGYGPPPSDIGNPGDFYLDLTHEGSSRYLIYVREGREWVCNNWSANPKRKEFRLHKHPLLKDRYLWGTGTSGFMWFTGDNLRKTGCYRIGDEHDPEPMIQEALAYIFDGPKLADDAQGKEKELAEIERRAKLRASWELNNNPPTSEDLERKEAERERRRRYEAESQRKLKERMRRRFGAIDQQEGEAAGPLTTTEQEPMPVNKSAYRDASGKSAVHPQDLGDLPKPAGRQMRMKARNASQKTSDVSDGSVKRRKVKRVRTGSLAIPNDCDGMPEKKRQRLDAQRRTPRVRNSGVSSPTLPDPQQSCSRSARWGSTGSDSEHRVQTGDNNPEMEVSTREVSIGSDEVVGESAVIHAQGSGDSEGQARDKENGEGGDNDADDEGDEGGAGERSKCEDAGNEEGTEEGADEEGREVGRGGSLNVAMRRGRPQDGKVDTDGNAAGEPENKGVDNDDGINVGQDAEPAGLRDTDVVGSTGGSTREEVAARTAERTQHAGERRGHSYVSDPMDIDESIDNAQLVAQKAADVHAFLLKNYSLIERERDALKTCITHLRNTLQKETDARTAEEERVTYLNALLDTEKRARATVTAELEEAKQIMEKNRTHDVEFIGALQDMTMQRDKAIAERDKSDHARTHAVSKLAKAKDLFTAVQQSLDQDSS